MENSKQTDEQEKKEKKYRVGICLSGGAALGLAHIGVLQALNDHQIYPEVLSGSSMGSIVGAIYAAGYTPSQMLQMIKDGKLYKLNHIMTFQPAFWKLGLSDHSAVESLLAELVPNNSFEKLEKELFVCVSNLSTGNWGIVSSGNNLNKWVAASSSVPGIFNAMTIGAEVFVDGGLLNNMPAQPLRDICEYIIGSDVIPFTGTAKKKLRSREIFATSIRVAQHQNSKPGRALCDFIIEPNAVDKYNELSFDEYFSIYQYGYRSATKFIAENPEILQLRDENPEE